MKNVELKKRILAENLKESGEQISLREYAELMANSDPGFFRWLFDTEGPDFECPDKNGFQDFIQEL